MRWWILVIVSFVGINSDKITVSWTKIIKLTWHHCSKIFKTNLKTHISPLLNRPQGCKGCQKNQKDLRFLTWVRFCANIQLKLHKIRNNTKKPAYFDGFCWFWRFLCKSFHFGWILAQKRTQMWNLRSFRFFWHPWHPWGWLSSGDIWFELEKSSKS
jgi:hypothetical protein